MVKTRRTWTKVGAVEMTREADDGGPITTRDIVARAVDGLTWHPVPCDLAAMPGMAINAMIQQLRLPKVSHVGSSNGLAPYGFVGARAHYKDGTAEVYAIDSGTEITPLLSDFHPAG